jgi:hypothetical protein
LSCNTNLYLTRLYASCLSYHKHRLFSLNETLNQTEIDMNNSKYKLTEELTNLLNETAEAHHKAFAATDGEDPEWPI